MIPYPHLSYVLELFQALGSASETFVLAGGQALRFHSVIRPTRDFDFILDVVEIRGQNPPIRTILDRLGYAVVTGSENFQFTKQIRGTTEFMRIELLAPDGLARGEDIRVRVEPGLHGRKCRGAAIAIRESDPFVISGELPDGRLSTASVPVTRPHALLLLKALAMDDRYRNIRGHSHAEHDRNEARIHAADIIALVSAHLAPRELAGRFANQFLSGELELKNHSLEILERYFENTISPGTLLYEEYLRQQWAGETLPVSVEAEISRAQKLVSSLVS